MKDRRYIDIFSSEGMKNVNEERKMKKFFRWAIPILVVELIVILGITAYFFILPKNYCEVSINTPSAIVYIKDKESKKVRLDKPKDSVKWYYYEIKLELLLPGANEYDVEFKIECEKYRIEASTTATENGDSYSMKVVGGKKTQIMSGFTIISQELIDDYNVKITIVVK